MHALIKSSTAVDLLNPNISNESCINYFIRSSKSMVVIYLRNVIFRNINAFQRYFHLPCCLSPPVPSTICLISKNSDLCNRQVFISSMYFDMWWNFRFAVEKVPDHCWYFPRLLILVTRRHRECYCKLLGSCEIIFAVRSAKDTMRHPHGMMANIANYVTIRPFTFLE